MRKTEITEYNRVLRWTLPVYAVLPTKLVL